MKGSEIRKLGIPDGPLLGRAQRACGDMAAEGLDAEGMAEALGGMAENPSDWTDHDILGELAADLIEWREFAPRDAPVEYRVWGENIDPEAIRQIENGCRIPVVERGAVMPDAHRGYNVPIGGVLAAKGAIMPGAVGVDIACRMKLSVTDIPASDFLRAWPLLSEALEDETAFGMGSSFEKGTRRDHPVLEDEDWNVSAIVKGQRDKAWRQLGSSGSGNHFAEWGIVEVDEPDIGLEPGKYVALLTHSGSRGPGARVSGHYVDLASDMRPELPDEFGKLAWLDLDSDEGQEFLTAMNLMGRYASACHEKIHDTVIGRIETASVTSVVENHHNFAWVEEWRGEEYVVHRKGATPAAEGELGVIPGTMVDPAHIVRGKGNPESINSAAHGAGRVMSRGEAKRTLSESDRDEALAAKGVELLSSGIDESPHVYKDISEVMGHQSDLVESIAVFWPKIVKMAPPEEPSWEGN